MRLRVLLYVPSRLYGFCGDESGRRVFFHASHFNPMSPGGPPPLLGEFVDVELAEEGRASSVRRVRSMPPITGVVDSFDAKTGWGFIRGDDRVSYFLHRSDVVHNRLLVRGQRVQFHAGHKNHRPRACYVEV